MLCVIKADDVSTSESVPMKEETGKKGILPTWVD